MVPRPEDGVETVGHVVERLASRRRRPGAHLAGIAGQVADACYGMATRFHRGGRLLVFGTGGASTDAQHISVEFVHPVIVGKRALPAISLTGDVATLSGIAAREGVEAVFAHQVRQLGRPEDIALGVSADGHCTHVQRGLEAAHERGLLTLALLGGDGGAIAASPAVDHVIVVPATDPLVAKEVHVTAYHVLWELVHVFLEQPGVFAPAAVGGR